MGLLDEVAGPAPQPAQASPTQPAQGGSLLDQVAAETPATTNIPAEKQPDRPDDLLAKFEDFETKVGQTAARLWQGAGRMGAAGAKAAGELAEGAQAAPVANGKTGTPTGQSDFNKMITTARAEHPIQLGVAKGAGELVGGVVADPRQWPLMFVGGESVSPILQKIISGGFGAQMSYQTVHAAGELAKNWDSMTPEDRASEVTQLVAGAGMAGAAVTHALVGANATAKMHGPEENPHITYPQKIEPEKQTIAGKRTTLQPTTQKTAGVEAPISALQQENPSFVTRIAAKGTAPEAATEFQKNLTAPEASRQLTSTVGQVAEDRINNHDAVMNDRPTPDKIAGTQTPSKFTSIDEIAKGATDKAQETYKKADVASDNDIATWQTTVKDALNDYKASVDRHNENIDNYNANRPEGEAEMPHVAYDPNVVSLPEKPQSYSELKADLDRAKAEGASADAAIREEAYKTGIPKAEKAIDGWFKQHSDIISPAEYSSAKQLYADSQRYQDIANGLRSAQNKGTVTGNTLRGLEATIDNKQIRRGQAPGAFKRLLGDEGYENWKTVTKLFDPIKGAPKDRSWGQYAVAALIPHMYGTGLLGKAASEWVMSRVMFDPAWGQWFDKYTGRLKDMVTREHGEAGAPGTVGEPFDNKDIHDGFFNLMDKAQGRAAADVKAQAQPTSLLDQVAKPEPQTVGTAEGAARDTALFQQAKAELGEGASISDVAKRAQELKTAPEPQPASTTHVTPVDPEDRAVNNAGRPSPERIAELDQQGMATRIPKNLGADVTNNPSHSRGLDAINEADKLNPTKEKANGDIKLGHKATVADKLADYPNSGVPLTAKERANPSTVINKYLDHFTGNLKDLYNSVPPAIKDAAVKWYETAHYSAKDMAERYGVSHAQATAVIASLSPQNFWDNNVGLADRFIKHWTEAKNHMWDPKMDEATDRIRDVQSKKIAKDEGKGKVASVVFRDILDNIRGKNYPELTKFAEDQGMDTNGLRRLQSQWLRMYDEAHGSSRTPLYSPDGSLRGTTARTHVPYDMEAKTLEILEGDPSVQHIHEVMGDGQKIRNFYNNIMNPWSKEGHVTIDTHAVGAAWGKPVSSADKTVTDNFSGAPGNGELGLSGMYSVYEEAYRKAAKELGVAPRELQSVTWEAIRSLIEEQDKKSPEFRKDIDDIWKQVENKKIDRATGMKQVMERAGGYKKPDWVRPEDWEPKQPPVSPASPIHQMVSLGTGDRNITTDVNPAGLTPEVMKWKGQAMPDVPRTLEGKIDYSNMTVAALDQLADYANANVQPRSMLGTAAHEAAHAYVQHALGTPTDGINVSLGHRAVHEGKEIIPGDGAVSPMTGISGGYVNPGNGWNDRIRAAKVSGDKNQAIAVRRDYVTSLMAGKAVEELLGHSPQEVAGHARSDINMAKDVLNNMGAPEHLHDMLIQSATDSAKAILKKDFDTVRHIAKQAVNHYGGKPIDSETFHKYRKGGVYEK